MKMPDTVIVRATLLGVHDVDVCADIWHEDPAGIVNCMGQVMMIEPRVPIGFVGFMVIV